MTNRDDATTTERERLIRWCQIQATHSDDHAAVNRSHASKPGSEDAAYHAEIADDLEAEANDYRAIAALLRAGAGGGDTGQRIEIETAIRELMADDPAFDVAIGRLCKLVGWRYPASETIDTTPADLSRIARGPDREFGPPVPAPPYTPQDEK